MVANPYDRGVERFDALVVGAGPAGSAAAIHLARAGASVLLVDKAAFPRDKPCGGGLTGRALRHLPCAVDPVVEHVVDRLVVRAGFGRKVARTADGRLIDMTQRRRLDLHLAEQAVAAGADFRDATAVVGIEIGGNGVSVRIDDSPIRASFLVGADGANGAVAKAAGLGAGIVRGVALEGNVPWGALERSPYAGTAWVELGIVPGGYGWVFPKGDHANLGVGGWLTGGPETAGASRPARAGARRRSLGLESVRGHRLPMRELGAPAARGRVLLVGDAAGLVDPLSGDGMYEAFISARLASEAIVAGTPETYERSLATALDRHTSASWKAKRALDRYPRACLWALRAPGVFGAVAGLLRGELAHPSEARRIARPPLRALSRLARHATPSA